MQDLNILRDIHKHFARTQSGLTILRNPFRFVVLLNTGLNIRLRSSWENPKHQILTPTTHTSSI